VEGSVMMTRTTRIAEADRITRSRDDHLRQILEERRRDILNEVHGRIRGVRSDAVARPSDGLDEGETGEVDIQDDISFALIQIKAETLARIDEALVRLDEGSYGRCFACGDEIAELRLRALPFALRCRDCEASDEIARRRERIAARRPPFSLFDGPQ
jgi:DnaK suppressor protein